jgi:hypothetical protein
MKTKILTLIVFLSLVLCSCHNIIQDYTIVESVKLNKRHVGITDERSKYIVSLRFYFINQVLYTDSLFNAGDTIDFIKRKK